MTKVITAGAMDEFRIGNKLVKVKASHSLGQISTKRQTVKRKFIDVHLEELL